MLRNIKGASWWNRGGNPSGKLVSDSIWSVFKEVQTKRVQKGHSPVNILHPVMDALFLPLRQVKNLFLTFTVLNPLQIASTIPTLAARISPSRGLAASNSSTVAPTTCPSTAAPIAKTFPYSSIEINLYRTLGRCSLTWTMRVLLVETRTNHKDYKNLLNIHDYRYLSNISSSKDRHFPKWWYLPFLGTRFYF